MAWKHGIVRKRPRFRGGTKPVQIKSLADADDCKLALELYWAEAHPTATSNHIHRVTAACHPLKNEKYGPVQLHRRQPKSSTVQSDAYLRGIPISNAHSTLICGRKIQFEQVKAVSSASKRREVIESSVWRSRPRTWGEPEGSSRRDWAETLRYERRDMVTHSQESGYAIAYQSVLQRMESQAGSTVR